MLWYSGTFSNCTFLFKLKYLWAHSACRTITSPGEWGLLIGFCSSQSECKEWVTGKPLHLSALTWYFTCRSSDAASHYLSNTICNWGSLCPLSCSRQVAPRYFASLRQRQGDMAVANFQYITRMSSGFKVYILEGEHGSHGSCFALCCMIEYLCYLDQWNQVDVVML